MRGTCPWCDDMDWEPFDDMEAERNLCHMHVLEYLGMSEDGYQRMLDELRKDRL